MTIEDSALKDKNKEIFIRFHFPEVKDHCKHFMVLISTSLIVSITFSEKIIPLESATEIQKIILGLCWLSLLTSLVLVIAGTYGNYLAAEKVNGFVVINRRGLEFYEIVRRAYTFIDVGVFLYVFGLLLLAIAGASKYFY